MLWMLSLHIIAVICWFAGLFYLPRLFVYHAMTTEPCVAEQFKVMEYKLYWYIMWPALIVTAISGHFLIEWTHPQGHWLSVKLVLIAILVVYQLWCGVLLYRFKKDQNKYSHKYYRWLNEIPTLLLIFIVILAVVKPF